MRLIILLLILTVWVEAVHARTWVVSQSHASASDDGDGTIETPLKSINAAATRAEAGDTVLIHAGVYRERVCPARGGEADKPITYQAAPGEKVIVTGSEMFSPEWTPLAGRPNVYRGSLSSVKFGLDAYGGRADPKIYSDFNPYLLHFNRSKQARPQNAVVAELTAQMEAMQKQADGEDVLDEAVASNQQKKLARFREELAPLTAEDEDRRVHRLTMGQIFVDDLQVRQVETIAQLTLAPNTWMVSPDGAEIWLHPWTDRSLSDSCVEITTRHTVFSPLKRGLGYIHVRGLIFQHAAGFFPIWWDKQWPQAGMVSCRSGHHWVIEDCEIRYAGGIGLDIGQEGHPQSVEFAEDWEGGVPERWQFVAAHEIRNNHIHDNGFAGISGWWAVQVRIAGNLIERNNRDAWPATPWYENGGIKLHQSRNAVIEGNLIRDNDCYGIWLDSMFPNARITRNVIVNNQWAGIFMEFGENGTIDNNIIAHTRSGDGIYAHDANKVLVAHNLLYNNSNYGAYFSYAVPRSTHLGKIAGCFGNRVVNNLILGNRAGAIGLPHDWELASDNRSDFNVLMGSGQYMDGSRVVQNSPIFIVNSDAHSAPEGVGGRPKMTRERLIRELLAKMADAGLPEASRPREEVFMQAPWLTLEQWRAATGNDVHSVQDHVVASRHDFFLTKLEWNHAFTDAIDTIQCEPIEGIDRDFYGDAIGEHPMPGPFQSLRVGGNKMIVWPVPGVPTSLGMR